MNNHLSSKGQSDLSPPVITQKSASNKTSISTSLSADRTQKQIKICGLQSVEVLKSMIPLSVDYIGFVFAKSKRQIDRERAAELLSILQQWPEGHIPQSVGVFVDPTLDELIHIMEKAPLDVIQLHGNETPELCKQIREHFHTSIIKVISVKDADKHPERNKQLEPYKGVIDAFLLDTYDPLYGGGSGKTFAWEEIQAYHRFTSANDIPLFIAGGLNSDNVHSLVNGYPLEGIDVSSGVETNGIKDIEKIKLFVERARA